MSEAGALLFPSRFFAWASNTQTTVSLDGADALIEEGQEGWNPSFGRRRSSGEHPTRRGESVELAQLEDPWIQPDRQPLGSRNLRQTSNDVYNVLARKLALQLQGQNALVHRWHRSRLNRCARCCWCSENWMISTSTGSAAKEGGASAMGRLIEQGSASSSGLFSDADVLLQDQQNRAGGQLNRGELLGEMALLSDDSLGQRQRGGQQSHATWPCHPIQTLHRFRLQHPLQPPWRC